MCITKNATIFSGSKISQNGYVHFPFNEVSINIDYGLDIILYDADKQVPNNGVCINSWSKGDMQEDENLQP